MAELVLTLNTFEFNGDYYKQVGGGTMGSKLGPNYTSLCWLRRGDASRLPWCEAGNVQVVHG